MLKFYAQKMSDEVLGKGEFREYDLCDHLTIVDDAIPDFYRFFDRFLGKLLVRR